MANEMFTHYDKARIAMLCEKAGLVQRALERYENIDDIKRALSRTELMQPDFIGVDRMPVRALAGREEEQDRGRGRARAAWRWRAPRLTEPAAFGVRLEIEAPDQPPRLAVRRATVGHAGGSVACMDGRAAKLA